MSGASSSTAFWQSLWSLFDAAIASGVDMSGMTPIGGTGKQRTSPAAVMVFAAEVYDIDLVQLTGPRKEDHLVEARALAAWGLRQAPDPWSLTAIGRAMGGRDHTTILHLIRRSEDFAKKSPRFRGARDDLRRLFHVIEEKSPCLQH